MFPRYFFPLQAANCHKKVVCVIVIFAGQLSNIVEQIYSELEIKRRLFHEHSGMQAFVTYTCSD